VLHSDANVARTIYLLLSKENGFDNAFLLATARAAPHLLAHLYGPAVLREEHISRLFTLPVATMNKLACQFAYID
jgi:hypothetical protein